MASNDEEDDKEGEEEQQEEEEEDAASGCSMVDRLRVFVVPTGDPVWAAWAATTGKTESSPLECLAHRVFSLLALDLRSGKVALCGSPSCTCSPCLRRVGAPCYKCGVF